MPKILLFFILLSVFSIAHSAQTRTALVIGNAAYADQPLKNPVNDARLMADTLKRQGFEVTTRLNANRRDMKEAIQSFIARLDKNSIGLFYFAGHGLEVKGRNYLVPVNASIASEADVEFEAIDAGRVLGGFEVANNGLNMLILDACRNNPYSRGFRGGDSRGLQPMRPASGSLVLYATEPGQVADDGAGAKNGLFTANLVKAINTPGLKIEDVFKHTAIEVHHQSGKQQTPYIEGVILGDFYFSLPDGSAPSPIQLAGGVVDRSQPQPDKGSATFVISSTPPGARIKLNGGDVGTTPVSIPLLPGGNYTLQADKTGYRSESQKIFLIAGQKRSVDFILDALKTGDSKEATDINQHDQLGNTTSGNLPQGADLESIFENARSLERSDSVAARKLFETAAKAGHSESQSYLGQVYLGLIALEGVGRNYRKAFVWLDKAAKQGDKYARYYLGMMYQQGMGIAKDEKTAQIYFRASCTDGFSTACLRLN
jgi:hypothetical protein